MQKNSKIIMNESPVEMNIKDSRNESEGIQSHSLAMKNNFNNKTDINSSHENTQSIPSGKTDAYSNEPQMDKFDFCTWYLKQLQNHVGNSAIHLRQDFISLEHKKFIRDCFENPQILLSQQGFGVFLSILQSGQQKSQPIRQDSAMGEESNEMSNRSTSSPTDENIDQHMDTQIQAPTQSNTSMSHISKDNPASVSSPDLSQLLLQQLEIIKGKILIDLKLIHPPKQFWHPRTINCLAQNDCPPIQSAIERQYIVLELSNLSNDNKNDFFAHVQLLTHDGKMHPSKFIVPPKTIVQDQENQILIIHNTYGCNLSNKTILYPLTTDKCDNCQITLQVIMFNAYKKCRKIRRSNRTQGSTIQDNANEFIEDELHKICKLRVQICRLTNTEQLEYVSGYIDTNLIKESKGTGELEAIDTSRISPSEPCRCGNEEITVLLNTNSEKAGFVVKINERQLALHEFAGVTRNTIRINPPPKTPEADDFHLTIAKRDVLKTIMQNWNPYEYLIEEILLDTRIKYANRNNICQHIRPIKKQKKE